MDQLQAKRQRQPCPFKSTAEVAFRQIECNDQNWKPVLWRRNANGPRKQEGTLEEYVSLFFSLPYNLKETFLLLTEVRDDELFKMSGAKR